jgi:glycosyltransferase involved in cell wall biosynthesis
VKYGHKGPPHHIAITKMLTIIKSIIFVADVELAKLTGVDIVWTIHDKYDHEENHKNIQILMGQYLVRRVDKIKVECSEAEKIVRDLYSVPSSKTIHVIPEGNYIDEYENAVTKKEARSELDIDSDDFVYLYFGSMRPYKGLPELVEAHTKSKQLDNTQLFLVGQERGEDDVQSALQKARESDNITVVTEYIPDDEIQLYFNAVDTVALPFRNILTSGSVLLSMGFGCPLVVRKLGCIPEIVPIENFLYKSQIEGLRQAMIAAYETENLDDISDQNLARAEELNWSFVAKETIRMYTTI